MATRDRRSRPSTGTLVALLLALASCGGVDVRSEDYSLALVGFRSYAWAEDAPQDEHAALEPRVRTAVDAELADRGALLAGEDEADVLFAWDAQIELRHRVEDPYFTAVHSAEQYEEGFLTLDVTDVLTGDLLWRGTGRAELRTVARGQGLFDPIWVATHEERRWPVEELVDAILSELPRGPKRD